MSRLIPEPRLSHHDANGKPFPGALCATYFSQTSNPTPVFKDSALTIEHTNPVVADDLGRFPVMYGNAGIEYKFLLTDAEGGNARLIDPASPFVLTQQEVGLALFPRAEAEEGIDIVDYSSKPYSPKRYGAVADGATDDYAAIQQADTLAASAAVPVVFDEGVYMVDCSTHASALLQTTHWLAERAGGVIIRRKDFTAATPYFTMRQIGKSDLRLSGIHFDGQVTTAASTTPNQDIALDGSYADTTDEHLWRKVYGVDIYNATRPRIDNCIFTNFLRAGLWLRGDGLATGVTSNAQVSNVIVRRTRSGSGGDGVYLGGVQGALLSNVYVEDYQRIGIVGEYAADNTTNCRDIHRVNCVTKHGHDAVAPESNVGFWSEDAENDKHANCTAWDTAVGFVVNAGSQSDTGSTRPWTASLGYVNCAAFRCKIPMRAGFGGTRSVHLTVDDFFGEANAASPSYANESLGLRAGILVQANEVTSGVNFRLDFARIKIHALNQGSGTLTNGFGCIRIAQGTVTSPQQLIVTVDGLQTQWSLTNGSDDVQAKTDYQSVTNGYFGDIVFSGANDTTPDGRFKGHATLRNLQNHTFGYAMVSSEIFSTNSCITISDSRVSMRRASTSNNGELKLANCALVDFRGDVGWTKIQIDNCTINDANSASKDRTAITCPLTLLNNNHILRQLWINAAGGDTTHRKLRLVASGNAWDIPFDTEPGLRFTLADGTFAQACMSGNAFRNLGTGSIGSTDVMIRVSTATGTLQFSGAGNVFDDAMIAGGGHMLETNSTPTYNDAPQTATGALLSVWGVRAVFDPI